LNQTEDAVEYQISYKGVSREFFYSASSVQENKRNPVYCDKFAGSPIHGRIIRDSVDHELDPAILGPRHFVLTLRNGTFFAVTDGVQSIGADAQADQELFH
jgi:hypothetical protein